MNGGYKKYTEKLFFKNWTIGIGVTDIEDVIRNKKFDPEIKWLFARDLSKYYADPFILHADGNQFTILVEEFSYKSDYGILSQLTLDRNRKLIKHKVLLDTGSHLSYPFFVTENNRTYIFPEAGMSGKLSCYEYDHQNECLIFVKDILDLPLRDATILKKDGKYWIFATINEGRSNYWLHVFYSDNLLGPYTAHRKNPIKSGLNGNRGAGQFIEVDGTFYRPTQNCINAYGESITLNKIVELNESEVVENAYFDIVVGNMKKANSGMYTIHTINVIDNNIVVDGIKWTFSPLIQLKSFINRRMRSKSSQTIINPEV